MLVTVRYTQSQSPDTRWTAFSSGLGFVPAAKMPVYSATKAGIHAFSMAFRFQLSAVGIKVFEVVPPAIDSEPGRPGDRRAISRDGL